MGKTLGYGEITVANMTEPFTVMLTNEAQQFATDSNRKVTSAQSYYTDIIVIRGSQERTDYTIGNITSSSGITVSKNSKRVTFSVSAGTTIGADAGVIEIPITLDGQTVKKQFSWSCGKQGPQGVKGNDGNSFAWNMLSETNCGKKHWGTESSGGKYSVEDFITEDNIDAVKLICTEAISTSNWSYVSFKDIKMLKQLKPSTKYTLSYDIKANRSGAISHSICKGNVSNFCTNTVVVNNIIGNETWQHISVVLTTNDLKTTPTNEILYLGRNALSKVGYSIIKNLKLVEGDIDTPWSPSQSDIEGKGVVETVQYYLATSQASGVTSSTSGWSTDITTQKLTADKKYLWNCYQTKYSDGTSEPISTPKVIGVYGDKGQNAKNLSITPSSQYFKSTDGGKTFAPNTITIKPTIQGEISFGKWQYSIDGGVSFVDVVSGQKGLTISNNVLTVSKDSSLYSDAVTMVTFRAVADDNSFYDTCSIAKIYDVSDIQIGGRNLAKKGCIALWDDSATFNDDTFSEDGSVVFSRKSAAANSGVIIDRYVNYEKDEHYIVSFKMRVTSGTVNSFYLWNGKGHTNNSVYVDGIKSGTLHADVSFPTDDQYHQITAYFTATGTTFTEASDIDINHHLILQPIKGTAATYTVQLLNFKIEKGNKATDWTPAPEDVQTAILSTKSEISDVSLKVDNNKQAIEQRVEKTTYQQDLKLVKGDISKANEGLNKWRYEIYPKSLFTSEYQGKSTMDVFAKNTNLTPSQSVLINDTDFGKNWAYGDNYIGYALTFVKFSAAKSVAITFKHDDGAHIYLNGKLIGGSDAYSQTGESLTLGFVKGWNCIEVVVNEGASTEGFKLGTTISAISECQLMNCYYGTPVARQSHITNQLVQNTTDIDGVSGSVQKVMSTVGGSGKVDEFVNNYSTWKKKVDGIETRVGETYTTKDDFNGLEIGGRNLVRLGGLSGNGATSFSYDKTTDTYTIVSPVVSTVWGTGAAVKYDDNHKVLIPYGKTYILSFEVKVPQALSINIDINNYTVSGSSWAGNDNDDGSTRGQSSYSIPANTWTKVWVRWANTNTKNTNKVDLYDNSSIGLVTKDCTSAVTWQIRHVKGELGNKPTDWTPAPEDVNGKIVNAETIANQTANKFSWIVKSGTSSSNFEITDRLMNLVSANINLDGVVSFMNTAKGDGRKNLYNLDYSSFENVASQEDAIWYAKDNGVTSVGIDSSVSYDGDKSLKISYTTANLNSSTTPLYLGSSTNNYGCVKIQAGKQYILSCYVKSDSTTGMFMIDIQGHDTPDTKTDGLYLSNIDPRRLPGSSTYVDLNTNWQRAVCAIKVADNATGLYWSVVPLIWGRPSSSSAPKTFNVWVDCIMLEEVDSISNEPGTYILDKETIIDGGSIKTDTITGNQILAGSITADKIATDAIKSRNYISSGGTQGSFLNLKDGSFTSPNLSWDANGNLIAKNANLSGEITATNGSIAGWTIISNKMYTTGSGKYTGIGKYGSAYAFWAGATSNDNGNSAVFKVGHTGKLTATDADITGTITATNGKIGRYDITSTYLMTNSGSNASGIGGNQAFWAGAEDSNSAPFRVGYDGVLWAEDAAIRGSIETGNLGDEGDTVAIINGHIGIQGTSNNVEIYSTGFKFGIDGDYYLMSVSEGVKCYRNLYATDFVADGWLYCSEVHSSGAVVIGADSESFYWAHGYQIARGTSWGGVCVGDDSQQLRLYGSSIWASHSISTSDENLKENFTTLDQYENFYMNLNPIGFNYIGDYDGKKTHFGFGAHKTEDVLESEGYDADKFAVVTHRPLVQEDIEKRFGKDVEVDIETEYGVSYTEFIALNTHMIQKTRRELTKVKQEKADLEVRLQAIEAKLGL